MFGNQQFDLSMCVTVALKIQSYHPLIPRFLNDTFFLIHSGTVRLLEDKLSLPNVEKRKQDLMYDYIYTSIFYFFHIDTMNDWFFFLVL